MTELTEIQKKILKGEICPYCSTKTELTLASEIYGKPLFGKDYGKLWICRTCNSYVGCHKGTNVALGRLANFELRLAKRKAHDAFDKLWKIKEYDEETKNQERNKAYEWLSKTLGIVPEYCHIGMFSEKTCIRVVEEVNKLNRKK